MVLGLSALSGCVDEKVVYRDRELYQEPLATAGNFLGYTDHTSKLTVCGNCHVEKQGAWEKTLHARAWQDLQANPAAQALCEGCHTVGQNGNLVSVAAGYEATGEERYEDVQCEACHGPGLTHVSSPTQSNVPLAALNVGMDAATGCGECHSGNHQPFVDEWAQSRHGDASTHKSFRENPDCASCHGGEGALKAWGINTNYLEKGDGDQIGVTCAVCHDPHGSSFEHQLRYSVSVANVDENLCMKCHQRRAIPDETEAQRGPHSPQGPLLLGEIGTVGWTPPNFEYDVTRIRGTHGSERNTHLCATCHVFSFEVTDPDTGDHVFTATGHLFKPIPCLDANGIPTADDSCPKTPAARSFKSCVSSGCHGDEDAAASALNVAQTRIEDLVTELNGLLDQVPPAEFDPADNVYTVAEGAKFNAGLGAFESSAVHNPFLTEALLTASIQAVQDEYGPFALQANVTLRNIMGELSGSGR